MYNLNEFGKEIKNIRKKGYLTQIDVAEQIGMQRDTLRRLENGKSVPKIETLEKLSSIYGKDIFMILIKHRITIDNYISKHIHEISKNFRNYDYEKISNEITRFEETFSKSNYYNDAHMQTKIHQYKTYLECLANIGKTLDDKSRENIIQLFLSLGLTQTKIKNRRFYIDKLELRIIILLGTVYRFKNEFVDTIELLDIALNEIDTSFKHDREFLYYHILVQFNRMSYYHRLDNFDKVKTIYEDTLSVIDHEIGVNVLFGFLTRSGMNKHFLQEPHLDGLVQTGLQILKDSGDLPQYENNLRKLKEKYPFMNLDIKYCDQTNES
ncbi:MAG: helix-turn-helix transcriptional regulator [Clostridiales bacterium]|nr:helix-turn-helix transcriptional regulator [Clostridiales bacterium]